jgi:CheY-like chemotaxis protein
LLAQLNGFILETAKNGEEALAKLASLENEPSIVFVDLNMPVMNGTEFLRKVRERGLATSSRIVIFSAGDKGSLSNLDQSLTWLAKPFDLADVLEAINFAKSFTDGSAN